MELEYREANLEFQPPDEIGSIISLLGIENPDTKAPTASGLWLFVPLERLTREIE
jgi:hypothetical protein